MEKLSCIICAYNEAPRIADVLKAAIGHPFLDEIIVVDDGSLDGTSVVVQVFPSVKLITYKPNRGKSQALAAGIRRAKNDLLLFLDADLKGLTKGNITQLVQPVLDGQADMSISVRANSLWLFRLIGLDFVSGERVLSKSLFKDLDEMNDLPPYGAEAWMNKKIIHKKLKIAVVWLDSVWHVRKIKKMGWWNGSVREFYMHLDMMQVLPPWKWLKQNWDMLSLCISPK